MYTPRPDPAYLRGPAQSLPLGSSHAANRASVGGASVRTAKVLGKVTEEHGKDRGGANEGGDETKEQLAKEVERLKVKIAQRDSKLEAQAAKASLNLELERKLQHLVDKYNASKLKHEDDLKSAQKGKTELKEELDIVKHQLKAADAAAADAVKTLARVTREATEAKLQNEDLARQAAVRGDRSLQEIMARKLEQAQELASSLQLERDAALAGRDELVKQNASLRCQVDNLRADESGAVMANQQQQNDNTRELKIATDESRNLRTELSSVVQQNADLVADKEHLEDLVEETQGELGTTKALLQGAALAYATLHRNSVPKAQHQATVYELARSKVRNIDMASEIATLQSQTCWIQDEVDDLRVRLDEAQQRASEAEAWVQQVLGDQTLDIEARATPTELRLEMDVIAVIHEQAQWTARVYRATKRHLENTRQALELSLQAREEVSLALQQVNALLQAETSSRKATVDEVADAVAKRDAALATLKTVEDDARVDREAVKRISESMGRWKVAEAALEEEVEGLRTALSSASRYEEAYVELEASYRALLSRQAETEDEAERLGRLNSELRGHGGVDRICYVETVRHESAAVKQELAATRSLLNTAHERIADLEDEIAGYKAVGSGAGPKRVRVVRRLREDGRLGTSVLGNSVAR